LLNNPLRHLELRIFHFDISGNNNSDSHPEKIEFISITLEKNHSDISGNDFNDEHPANIELI
jgi:hypothetical protein